jgi:SAM-dependent methyltransferase
VLVRSAGWTGVVQLVWVGTGELVSGLGMSVAWSRAALVARWCGMGEAIRPATGATGQDAGAVYALGSSLGESARLERQAEELAADSAALLDRVGLRPGQSAIDLGCGPQGILGLLAGRVAPAGRIVGLDADPAHAARAAEFAAGRGLSGVEIITGDARSTGLPPGSFDLVHARTLLVNVPEPAEVVAEMTRLARPGGWVASMEPDTEHALCYPPHPAFGRLQDIFTVAFRRNGADPWIGRRVPELLRRAGLEHVGLEARAQLYPHGNSRRTIRLDLVQSMRPQVLEMGLATAAELDELDAAARAHLDDPDTVVLHGLLFLTWGRKPDHATRDPAGLVSAGAALVGAFPACRLDYGRGGRMMVACERQTAGCCPGCAYRAARPAHRIAGGTERGAGGAGRPAGGAAGQAGAGGVAELGQFLAAAVAG